MSKRKRIGNLIRTDRSDKSKMSTNQLAKDMGYSQPNIWGISKRFPDAWVYFDDDGKAFKITYKKDMVLIRKGENGK